MSTPWAIVRFPVDCVTCRSADRINSFAQLIDDARHPRSVYVLACEGCRQIIREATEADMTAAYHACERTRDEISEESLAMRNRSMKAVLR